jgi:hypothetical protein
MARRISFGLLALGAALIWPIPLGGALLMLTGALGFAVDIEDELMSQGAPAPPAVLDDAA